MINPAFELEKFKPSKLYEYKSVKIDDNSEKNWMGSASLHNYWFGLLRSDQRSLNENEFDLMLMNYDENFESKKKHIHEQLSVIA